MNCYTLALILLLGCSVIKQSSDEMPVLFLEKSACYGQCPVYRAEIFPSGKMIFQGTAYTKIKGIYCGNIDKKDISKLIDAFNKQNYFSFNEVYRSRAKDLPTTTTGFYYEGKQKTVRDYDKAPPDLKFLEKMLETLVDTTSWKICN